jgi:hypothetical protein
VALSPGPPIGYISWIADASETHLNETMSSGAWSHEEALVFDDIIRTITPLPEGVQRVGFRFGADSTVARAVWITLVAQDDLKPSKEKIAAFQRVADEVRSDIIRRGSERWPYVEIVTE